MMRRRTLLEAALAAAFTTPALAAPDDGAPYEWRSVPFGAGGFIDGFVFHPRERGLLYARTDIGGAYRFEPGTRSWTPLLDHLGKDDADLMGVLSLAVDPNDANRLYAACGLYTGEWARKAALLVSADRGATWQQHELGLRLGGNEAGRGSGERLQVDPADGNVLLLGTTRDGLLKSSDRGRTFTRLALDVQHVSLVLFDPRAPGQVYAGSHDKPGLYASRDGGKSFAREPGTPAQAPQRAVFGPEGTLYVSFAQSEGSMASNPGGTQGGSVWKRDAGGRWRDITPLKAGRFGYSGLDVDARRPGRIVVSTIERWSEGDDIFVSTDDGAHWQPLGARSRHDASRYPWLVNFMRGQDRMGHWIADVKIDPHDGERAVYGTGYGLWMTANLGAETVNWDFTVANFEETATPEVRSPSGGATLLAAMSDVGGAAWDDTAKTPKAGLFAPTTESNRGVDVAELKPAIIARTSDAAATGGYVSADGGVSWRPFGASTRAAKGDSGRIAVSAGGGFFVWAPDRQPALFSRDRGRSWAACEGWPADRSVALVPVADRAVEGVFHVHDRASGQVLTSADGGRSFKPAITGLPKVEGWQSAQLVAAPGNLRDLWLALPDGLLHLPGVDKPARMVRGVEQAWLVALGKAAPGAPYHSVYVWGRVAAGGAAADGLFRSDDGGAGFRRIDDDRHRYGRLLSISADPLEHGTVYLAPHGRGVVVGRPRT
jgi:hypothetical protein